MRYLLDTNVYFSLLCDTDFLGRHRDILLRIAPRMYLSSVVQFELVRGARGDLNRARLDRVTRQLERTGRVVAPTHDDWRRAGVAQGRIWDRHHSFRTKDLENDLLIAASARRIGAVVVTENVRDFELIRPYLPHRAVSMARLASELHG